MAVQIAQRLQAEGRSCVIINGDAMQVYQEIPILAAQPTLEDQQGIEHRLYGHHSAQEPYNVSRWLEEVVPIISDCLEQQRMPIIVGGTGMYIKSLIYGIAPIPDISQEVRQQTRDDVKRMGNEAFHARLSQHDPQMASRLAVGDTQRMVRAWEVWAQTGRSLADWQVEPHRCFFDQSQFEGFFLHPERQQLYAQCNARFVQMMKQGAMEEVRSLDLSKIWPDSPALKALGVPELLSYQCGDMSIEDAINAAQQATRRYAKRQITWFSHQLPLLKDVATPDQAIAELTQNNAGSV